MTYLKYLNGFSSDTYKKIRKDLGLSMLDIAKQTKIKYGTLKNWGRKNPAVPAILTWNLFIYEMEAKRQGFDNLTDLIESAQNKSAS